MRLTGEITADRPLLVVAVDEEATSLLEIGLPVLVTGAGKVNAAAATAAVLARSKPSEVVNLGTAGALLDGLEGLHTVGGVIEHDFDSAALVALTGREFSDQINFGEGPILATGDKFISDDVVRGELAKRAELVDMEGYGVAKASAWCDVPVRLIKLVSDSGDEAALKSWVNSVHECAEQLAQWVKAEFALA